MKWPDIGRDDTNIGGGNGWNWGGGDWNWLGDWNWPSSSPWSCSDNGYSAWDWSNNNCGSLGGVSW